MLHTRLITAWLVFAIVALGAIALTANDLHSAAVPPVLLQLGR